MWEMTYLLQAVLSLVQPDAIGGQLLMRPFAVTGLVSLMSPRHLAAVTSWQHTSEEEGSNNAQSILSLIAAILHNPFLPGGASDALVKEVQEVHITLLLYCPLKMSSCICLTFALCNTQRTIGFTKMISLC